MVLLLHEWHAPLVRTALSPSPMRALVSLVGAVILWAGVCTGGEWRQVPFPPAEPWTFASLSGHTSEVYALAFNPEGTLLATGEMNAVFRIWDARSWQEIRSLAIPPLDPRLGTACPAVAVAWSPDGRMLVLGTPFYGGPLYLWDTQTGAVRALPTGGMARMVHIAFSPDGSLIAGSFALLRGAGPWGTVVWDVASGEKLCVLPLTFHLEFTGDGKYLLGATLDWETRPGPFSPRIVMWEVGTWREAHVYEGLWGPFSLSPCGRYLAAVQGIYGSISLVELGTGVVRARLKAAVFGHGLSGHERASPLGFSPDGESLAFVGEDGALWLWTWRTGALRATPAKNVRAAAFSPDGLTLVTASRGRPHVEIWDLPGFTRRGELPSQTVPLEWGALALSPDGSLLASAARSEVVLWDLNAGRLFTTLNLSGLAGPVAYHPHRPWLAVGVRGRFQAEILVWDGDLNHRPLALEGHRRGVTALAFAPSGTALVSGGADGFVYVWDLTTADKRLTLSTGTDAVVAISLSPNGDWLAVASVSWPYASSPPPKFPPPGWPGSQVSLWDLKSGEKVQLWEDRSGPLAFSPCGQYLAMAHAQGMEIFDLSASQLAARIGEPGERPLFFTPDGKYLVARTGEGRVRFYRPFENARIREIPSQSVFDVLLDPARGLLYTAHGYERDTVILSAVMAWHVADMLVPGEVCGPQE